MPAGGSATFTGPNTIANIVGRVTGGQPSAIDGVLRSEIAGAHLYLLNPSGMLFGRNASLDVSGSLHVSTADVRRFADGATFSAHLGQASVLTVAAPATFGFLGANPAAISIRESVLRVPQGKTLSIVGGDIDIAGGPLGVLAAPSGRIQLASVASPGDVPFSPLELAPDLRVDSFARLGRLTLSQGANLDTSGARGGTVLIRSGHLTVDRSKVVADNTGPVDGSGLGVDLRIAADAVLTNSSSITTQSEGAGRAGDVRLTAGGLHMDNSRITSASLASGHSGNITVNVGRLTLTGGALIGSFTEGAGQGGTITLIATEAITLAGGDHEGFPSGLFSDTEASGDAGSIVVEVGSLTLADGAQIGSNTFGEGRGGMVTVVATDSISIAGRDSGLFSNTFGRGDAGRLSISTPRLTMDEGDIQAAAARDSSGNAGSIDVRAGRLTLTSGAQIGSHTFGEGRGGTLIVAASEAITIAGRTPMGVLSSDTPSGIASFALGRGDAGPLTITAPTLRLADRGILATTTLGAGRAGALVVDAERLTLTGGALIDSSTVLSGGTSSLLNEDLAQQLGFDLRQFRNAVGSGPAGDIDLRARDIQLAEGATISATSAGPSHAGNLRITAQDTFLSERSTVTTAATQASGGSIELRAGSRIRLIDSQLTASVRGGLETVGGNLTLEAPFIISDGSQLSANAIAGRGGNIAMRGQVLLTDPTSRISASSELGIQGTVEIRAPVTTLSGTLAPLPQAFVNVAALLPARCAARFSGGKASSLILGGREGLPADPSGVLSSPLVFDERLVANPAVIGALHQQTSAAKFALLAGQEKALPRLGCPK